MPAKGTAMYAATIELNSRATPARIDDTVKALEGFHPVAGPSPRGRVKVVISLPAAGLQQAVTLALALVERATGAAAGAVEVMTSEEFDSRAAAPPAADLPALVSVTEAADMLGVTRQAVLQMIDRGKMPARQAGNTWVMALATVEQLL